MLVGRVAQPRRSGPAQRRYRRVLLLRVNRRSADGSRACGNVDRFGFETPQVDPGQPRCSGRRIQLGHQSPTC